MKIYKKTSGKFLRGYKVMYWDAQSKKAYSMYDKTKKIELQIGNIYSMGGNGIYLGNSKEYVLKYFSGGEREKDDPQEVVLTFEFDSNDIIKGEFDVQYESEGSVRKAKLVDFEVLP